MDTPQNSTTQPRPPRRISVPVALFLLLIAVVIVTALYGFQSMWQKHERSAHYQAVFLSNGQVYFGKILRTTNKEIVLDNVYYLQSNEELQQESADQKASTANTNTATTFSLVKLGGEIHGPLDRMYITRSNVLFTEDLRDNSRVVQTIQSQR